MENDNGMVATIYGYFPRKPFDGTFFYTTIDWRTLHDLENAAPPTPAPAVNQHGELLADDSKE